MPVLLTRRLAALCVVVAVSSVALAQEAEKTEDKPDLAKRALDVLFDSGAEKDADADTKAPETQEAKPAPAGGEKTADGSTPAKPDPNASEGTPKTPWPNKDEGNGTGGSEETPKPKPKPFVPPTRATGDDKTPDNGTGGAAEKPPANGGQDSDPPRPVPGGGEAGTGTGAGTAPAATPKTYTIKNGDTFSSIAIDLYGDEKKWAAIAQANPLVDPTKLKVGQQIRLPDLAKAAEERERVLAEAADAASAPGASGTTVTVQPGDTLSHIAHRVYGKARHWGIIYEANKDQLKDPGDVKVGQKLKIPPKPAED